MKKYFPFIFVLGLFHSCFKSDLVFEDEFKPVVEAYLFNNQQIDSIHLSSMFSFGNDTSMGGQNIAGALVELIRGEESWFLLHNVDDSGAYYLPELIEMHAGDSFDLKILLDDLELTASTVVPEEPPLIILSEDTIYISSAEDMMEFKDMDMPDPIIFSWDNDVGNYYFFRVQNIETYEDLIMPEPPDDMPFKRPDFNFQMDSKPTNSNSFELSMRELTHFGTHRVIVYSVNYEYVALYNSQEQDDHELNEPFSNIENGLGIFTSFSSDTLYFEVLED